MKGTYGYAPSREAWARGERVGDEDAGSFQADDRRLAAMHGYRPVVDTLVAELAEIERIIEERATSPWHQVLDARVCPCWRCSVLRVIRYSVRG